MGRKRPTLSSRSPEAFMRKAFKQFARTLEAVDTEATRGGASGLKNESKHDGGACPEWKES